jgi:hypothetical protein
MSGNGTSRGEFLARGAGVAGMVIGAGVWAAGAGAQTEPTADAEALAGATTRAYSTGHFALELDGILIGLLKSVDGGSISADVVSEKQIDYFSKKHIANVKYEDFTIECGFTMSKTIYDWINKSWTGNAQRKNGAVVAADFKYEAKTERRFRDALLTQTTIPACDGSSKEPAYLKLGFAPEQITSQKASGKLTIPTTKTQKQWLPSNFKLEIDGLDCSKVSKIDAFTIKQSVVTDPVGEQRDYEKEPGKLEFPNLSIMLAETAAQTWFDYFESFVIQGNSGEANEKYGTLSFLDSTLKETLAHIRFFNLGIFKLSEDKAEANSDQIKRVKAELYCERMEIKMGAPLVIVEG